MALGIILFEISQILLLLIAIFHFTGTVLSQEIVALFVGFGVLGFLASFASIFLGVALIQNDKKASGITNICTSSLALASYILILILWFLAKVASVGLTVF